MAFIDYYKVLGIPKTADEKKIKAAYRKLARKYHPDVNADNKEAELKFKEINEANEVLSNPENRKKYDKYGKDWKQGEAYEKAQREQQQRQSQYRRGGQSHSGFEGFGGGDYSDFFESMFGGSGSSYQRAGSPRYKGQDFHASLHLSIRDVYKTHQQVLTVNGKKIRLTIPAGVENGQKIKIPGKGEAGINGGPHGDLYIEFIIENTTPFKREGANLYQNIDIDLYTALLGGEILADTFDGKVKLKIKPETSNGTKVKLKGKGFPVYKKEGQFGDLIITYQVKTPHRLSDKEKSLFKELQKMRAA